MMVTGIVLVSLVPVALLASTFGAGGKEGCQQTVRFSYEECNDYDLAIYGGIAAAIGLAGTGVPLIVIGAKRDVPPATATISPWATPLSAGISVRLAL